MNKSPGRGLRVEPRNFSGFSLRVSILLFFSPLCSYLISFSLFPSFIFSSCFCSQSAGVSMTWPSADGCAERVCVVLCRCVKGPQAPPPSPPKRERDVNDQGDGRAVPSVSSVCSA